MRRGSARWVLEATALTKQVEHQQLTRAGGGGLHVAVSAFVTLDGYMVAADETHE